MLQEIHIENFKSIENLTLELGRINVFIGENGCGKSNILEAIAFGTAASRGMLGNEFLVSRGIRVTEPRFMRSAFREETQADDVRIGWKSEEKGGDFQCALRTSASATHVQWEDTRLDLIPKEARAKLNAEVDKLIDNLVQMGRSAKEAKELLIKLLLDDKPSRDFLIYAPENSALRNFQAEGQILPLGSKGEGLFGHLRALANAKDTSAIEKIVEHLALIDWFERFDIPTHLSPGERTLLIRDRYLQEGALFDQRSANEGFLFLLFYFTLFISPDTPSFFAIDNVDGSLNPKLCAALVEQLAKLAKAHDKQAILTTHNPAVLDGLDLNDPDQRLFVIHRVSRGPTKARRILAPTPVEGQLPMKLSAAFLAGHIGGLPKNF